MTVENFPEIILTNTAEYSPWPIKIWVRFGYVDPTFMPAIKVLLAVIDCLLLFKVLFSCLLAEDIFVNSKSSSKLRKIWMNLKNILNFTRNNSWLYAWFACEKQFEHLYCLFSFKSFYWTLRSLLTRPIFFDYLSCLLCMISLSDFCIYCTGQIWLIFYDFSNNKSKI